MKNLTLFKQTALFSFIGAIIFTPSSIQALTVEEVINPRQDNHGWVTDMADILSDRTETELNDLITNLEQNNGTEIAVVTVPDTAPAISPKVFTTELFNHWGIGKAELDNGILFLVSLGDKRVEIETGYGITNVISDAEVAEIIETKITPEYKHGNFDLGTLDGTKTLISILQPSANTHNHSRLISNTNNETKGDALNIQTSSFLVVFMLVLIVLWIASIAPDTNRNSNTSNSKKGKKRNHSNNHNYTDCDSSSFSSGGFFSGGSDGGGGDFGGGSSDGGGAGGDF